jgi:hypothetical protein
MNYTVGMLLDALAKKVEAKPDSRDIPVVITLWEATGDDDPGMGTDKLGSALLFHVNSYRDALPGTREATSILELEGTVPQS